MSAERMQATCAAWALRPDWLQYFIYYATPGPLGWSVVCTWSPDSAELVKQAFQCDFWDSSPRVVAVICPGFN